MFSHLLISCLGKFEVQIVVIKIAVKTGLKSETVHYAKITPHDDTCSLELGLLQTEPTRMITELCRFFGDELRNDSHLQIFIRVQRLLWTIDKDVFLS